MMQITENSEFALKHSTKLTVACFIAWALYHWFNIPHGHWVIITVIVVMMVQLTTGSILRKSIARLVGTLVGGLVAIIVIELMHSYPQYLSLMFILATPVVTYITTTQLKTLPYAGIMALVTFGICIFQPDVSVSNAYVRVFDILLGIVVSFVVGMTIFPYHAKDAFVMNCRQNFKLLDQAIKLLLTHKFNDSEWDDIENQLIANIKQGRLLLHDANAEVHKRERIIKYGNNLLERQKRCYRALSIVYIAHKSHPESTERLCQLESIQAFQRLVVPLLQQLADDLYQSQPLDNFDQIEDILAQLERHISHIKARDKHIKDYATHSFFLGLQYFADNLRPLIRLVR